MNIVQKVIPIFRNFSKPIIVSCSGGADSLALLHFMNYKDRKTKALFVHHNTECSVNSLKVVKDYCSLYNIELIVRHIDGVYTVNKEHNWRQERYKIFHSFTDHYLMTAHHLDDQVEQYLMSSIKGKSTLIPYRNNNIHRPFLYLTKETILEYCRYHSIKYYDDPDNYNESNNRAITRNQIVPLALKINPGLYTTVERLVRNSTHVWK